MNLKSLFILAIAMGLSVSATAQPESPINCTSKKGFEVTTLNVEVIGSGPEYRAKMYEYSEINHMAPQLIGDFVVSRISQTKHVFNRPIEVVFYADENGEFRFDPKTKDESAKLFAKLKKPLGSFYAENLKCDKE